MTDIITELRALHGTMEAAHHDFVDAVKEGIKAGLADAFADPSVTSVAFGVACQPYNDESAGQGVYGPVVNFIQWDDDVDPQDALEDYDFTNDDEYALFYDRPAADPKAKVLGEVLRLSDWKYAGEAMGVTYYEDEGSGTDEAFVAVRDKNKPAGYRLERFEVGEY